MIEYRFRSYRRNSFAVINKYTPKNKSFKIDETTGEAWMKVTNQKHTPEFIMRLTMYCQLLECEETLKIIDCSNMEHTATYSDDRPSLF